MNRITRASAKDPKAITRRAMLQRSAGVAAAGTLALAHAVRARAAEDTGPAATKGRIKQSIVPWCFELFGDKWNLDKTCQVAKELGCPSVELILPNQYPILKRHGLACAIGQIDMNPDPPFLKGFNHPTHWPRVMKATQEAIDAAAAFGTTNVICFTGYTAQNPGQPNSKTVSKEKGAANCVEGFKKIVGYAEKKKVTLCMEILNSRETSHPMKGHPGYQGDHTDYCIDIIRRVGSPRLKLLFDVYHVQVMDGDIIRRLREHKEYIGHIHVAGNPGRGELDDQQELNFRPIMQALVDMGYTGYVGQEFIPTRNPYQGLREAVALCDV